VARWRDQDGSSGDGGDGGDGGGSGGSTTVLQDVIIIQVTETITGDTDASGAGVTVYNVDAQDGDVRIGLPDVLAGRHLHFKKTDPTLNKVIVDAGANKIDGMDEVWITQQYDAMSIISSESAWNIV